MIKVSCLTLRHFVPLSILLCHVVAHSARLELFSDFWFSKETFYTSVENENFVEDFFFMSFFNNVVCSLIQDRSYAFVYFIRCWDISYSYKRVSILSFTLKLFGYFLQFWMECRVVKLTSFFLLFLKYKLLLNDYSV